MLKNRHCPVIHHKARPTMALVPDETGLCNFIEVPAGRNKEYVAGDFSVKSIVDSGSYDLLKPCAPLSSSLLDVSDNLDVTVSVASRASSTANIIKSKTSKE